MNISERGDQNFSSTCGKIEVLTFEDAVGRIRELEHELQCMSGVMRVMKEDLQIKDEQFDFLYASIRARNEQHAQLKQSEDDYLREHVLELESIIRHRDLANDQLQSQLQAARKQLFVLKHGNIVRHCYIQRIPDELLYHVMTYTTAIATASFSISCSRMRGFAAANSLWSGKFKNEWGVNTAARFISLEQEKPVGTSSHPVDHFNHSFNISEEKVIERGGQCLQLDREDSVQWSRLYGQRHMVDRNLRRGCSYVHTCKGHNGTVTCLALATAERGRTRIFSGSDDGSVILWDISPSTRAHLIHSNSASDSSNVSASGVGGPKEPILLPPPTLPLAQLVEGGGAGGNMWPSWKSNYSRGVSAGAGAELPSLSTSPPQAACFSTATSSCKTSATSAAQAISSSPPSHYAAGNGVHGCFTSPPVSPPTSYLSPIPRPPPVPTRLRTFHGHGGPVWAVGCDGLGGWMASGSYDQCIKVWDTATQQCQRTLRGHDGWVSSLAVLRRGGVKEEAVSMPRVVSASYDTTIKVWNPATGDLLSSISAGVGNALYCMALDAVWEDGGADVVAVGCRQCDVQCWNVETRQAGRAFLGHSKEVYSVILHGNTCFSGSGDSSIKMWDVRSGSCIHTYAGHRGSVMTLQFDGDYRLVSGSYDKTVKMWDIRSMGTAGCAKASTSYSPRTSLSTLDIYYPVFCLQFIDVTGALVVGSTDYKLRVYDFAHFK